ncbi:hypothetical protein [Streptomyces sp. rh34]|uniref:hypothetical protein n=1 Tax=Streptomyces sp. rh34 TaxID=2034272 RepID=UPI000BEFAE19|nr:hypothetical protein [Streptomyces sp. rh34]
MSGEDLENSYECACGAWVRITHKGGLARHSLPDAEPCPLSGEPVDVPAERPTVRGLLRMVPPAPAQGWEKPAAGRGGSSVYAIPAGLPGGGRRR